MRSRRVRTLVAGAATLAIAVAIAPFVGVGPASAGPDANPPGSAALATEITNKFTNYGNSFSVARWTGGDGLEAIKLADGRVLWFFNDYYYGTVNTDLTRSPFQASMPRNGIVIQNADGTMGGTVTGGAGATLFNSTAAGRILWGGDQRLEGGTVQKFYMRINPAGWGEGTGVELRTIPVASVSSPSTYGDLTSSLPDAVTDCAAQPFPGHCILWGMALADAGGYTYVYGSDVRGGTKTLRIARVPQGNFAASGWTYWNGTDFVAGMANAVDTGAVASEAMSVTYQAGRWVLVTQDTVGGAGGNVIAYYADSPDGFTSAGKTTLFKMPETTPDWGVHAYTPRLIPHLSSGGNDVIIGYSVNSDLEDRSCGDYAYIDASVYRPHFKAITLPAAGSGSYQAPDGTAPAKWLTSSNLPAWCGDGATASPPPPALSAPTVTGNNSTLTWTWSQPTYPNASWTYGIQFHAQGTAWPADEFPVWAPSPNSSTASYLTPGRTYEFRVKTVTWENRASTWATNAFTMPIDRPTALTATRTNATRCSLKLTDPQVGVFWNVQQRKAGTTAWTSLGAVGTKTPWFTVTAGIQYDYRVQAYSDYDTSTWTAAARCPLP